MIIALGMITIGGVLIYSAFQTPPDPRDVLSRTLRGQAQSNVKAGPHPAPSSWGPVGPNYRRI